MFFYLCKVLFSGFLEFRGNFVDGRNNLKYRDVASLIVVDYGGLFTNGKVSQILRAISRSTEAQ